MLEDFIEIPSARHFGHYISLICPWHESYPVRNSLFVYEDFFICQSCGKKGSDHNYLLNALNSGSTIHFEQKKFYNPWNDRGKKYNTHRLIWILLNGEVKKNICVCHKCDNRKCINPDHLFAGTYSDNMQDCSNKNRLFYNGFKNGENHYNSKLKTEDVIEIRRIKQEKNISNAEIARMFDVCRKTISAIVRNETWKHLLHK